MSFGAWLAAAVTLGALIAIAAGRLAPYLALLGALGVLVLAGVIEPATALVGFSNPAVFAIALLFVVAAGMRETGAMAGLLQPILGNPRSPRRAQGRLMVPVIAASGFLNNTPLVAMLLPIVKDWARRIRVPASQLLIPLSYASILGGLLTLIGTSTNVVVHGLLIASGRPGLGMFTITPAGAVVAAAGFAFLIVFGAKLLPRREDGLSGLSDPREYTLEMMVEEGGAIAGKTVEQAGLRHLPGIYLAEIHRRGQVLAVVGPEQTLEGGDQIVFVGLISAAVDLRHRPGLAPAARHVFAIGDKARERWFVEAVVSHRCPIAGQSVRNGRFRTRYGAVVIGVARHGERLRRRLGDVVLRAGDVLLLEAPPAFVDHHRDSTDFYLVSRVEGQSPPRHDRAGFALAIVGGMVAAIATGALSLLEASAVAAMLMLVTRSVSQDTARRSIDWQVLVAIAAAFGLGAAIQVTGLAGHIATGLIAAAGDRPHLVLAAVYLVTLLLSEIITNNAAAAAVFPIALETADHIGAHYLPFVIAVMIAASACFSTPISYQTHLMVYGAGGYRFRDFIRVGLPLDLLLGVVAVIVIPLFYPLF